MNNYIPDCTRPGDRPNVRFRAANYWLAIATAAFTFPLIFMGGLVTSYQAGLAVPDWPNSYGYNMFLYPPAQWVGGIFYEHTHRLLGTLVGLCAVALALFAWAPARRPRMRVVLGIGAAGALAAGTLWAAALLIGGVDLRAAQWQSVMTLISVGVVLAIAWGARYREARSWVRWLTVAVLAAVIIQGFLGGLRVVWTSVDLALIHGCFAQAFFCLAALVATVNSKWWIERVENVPPDQSVSPNPLVALAFITTGLIYLQLIFGATMRHFNAGLAIPDFPLTYGQILPPTDAATMQELNEIRLFNGYAPVTLEQVWIHFIHRVWAIVVTVAVLALSGKVFIHYWSERLLRRPAIWLVGLIAAQVLLGVATVLMRKPADIATGHVAVGALILVTAFILGVRGAGLLPRGVAAIRPTLSPTRETPAGIPTPKAV